MHFIDSWPMEGCMDTEYLKTFLTLAENGNFSETAKRHYVVQSAVSARIRELENEVGQKIFIRNHNHAELTPAGKVLLDYVKRIIDLESMAIMDVNSTDTFFSQLTIGTVYAFYDSYMQRNVQRHITSHSDISLKIIFGHSGKIISDVNCGLIDIGYSHYPYNHSGFCCNLLNEDDVILVTGQKNGADTHEVSFKQLRNLPMLNSNFLYSKTYELIYKPHRYFQLDIDIGSKVIPYILESKYYAFLSKKLIESEIKNGKLIEIPIIDWIIPPVQNFVIYKKNSQRISSIMNWLDHFTI
jgi:LysR family transcriptional repressor of citA